jgi:hypothetical protein
MDTSLDAVRDSLWDTANKLWKILNDPATPTDVSSAADLEYIEVNHRLSITQGQSLSNDVASLQGLAAKVQAASTAAQAALDGIKKAIDVTNGITAYLTAVDNFIDAAKGYFT